MSIKKILIGKKLVSLPFSDYCEPLIYKNDEFESLIKFLISYCEKENIESFEIRGGCEYFKKVQPAYSYYEHILELGMEEKDILKNFNETTRRNIKKAVKDGIQTSVDFNLNSLKEFYRLNCITRKRHGLPPQPLSFFKQLFQNIIQEKKAFIISAKYKGNVIASAV
jgi:sugar-specific transcriptional regulator TrmB